MGYDLVKTSAYPGGIWGGGIPVLAADRGAAQNRRFVLARSLGLVDCDFPIAASLL